METGEPGFAFQNASSLVDQVPDISGDSEKELLKLKDKDTAREVTGPPPVDKAFSMGGTG